MLHQVLTVDLRHEEDVFLARQRGRQLAEVLGFDTQDQARIATAISEVARAVWACGPERASVELLVQGLPGPMLVVRIPAPGPGGEALDSEGPAAAGLVAARRLMERCDVERRPDGGATLRLGKLLPAGSQVQIPRDLPWICAAVQERPLEDTSVELRRLNQHLMRTLETLRAREEEIVRLGRELEDTNRGVVALYAELDDKAESLRRATEMKSRFLSYVSHEFRTPLNAVLSLSRLLLDRVDGDLNPEQERQVAFIRRAAEDLTDMVNDLLDLARVESGKLEVHPSSFRVSDLLGALRALFRPLVPDQGAVRLLVDETAGIPPLWNDEAKISQILRNFVSNAVKFTERGEVRVWAELGEGGMAVFSVLDTGIGIAPEDLEKIFEEFAQVDSRVQRRVRGTGLGLPLSRRLAELLGGHISVRSTPGAGSLFQLTVPLRYGGGESPSAVPDAVGAADTLAAATGSPSMAGKTALVVDDDEVARYTIRHMLGALGITTAEASDGERGLRLVGEVRPDLVVLDLVMPGMDGFRFLEVLDQRPEGVGLPVIVYTSKRLAELDRARLGRASLVLTKGGTSVAEVQAGVRSVLAAAAERQG